MRNSNVPRTSPIWCLPDIMLVFLFKTECMKEQFSFSKPVQIWLEGQKCITLFFKLWPSPGIIILVIRDQGLSRTGLIFVPSKITEKEVMRLTNCDNLSLKINSNKWFPHFIPQFCVCYFYWCCSMLSLFLLEINVDQS